MKREKYEISLWNDILVDVNLPTEHFDEEKIAVIGSNTITAQWRAVEPKLIKNINGSNTFTFKMYYTYIDTETGERVQNPFLSLLVNERKIKVFWENKWYDFVIKSCQEDSSGKSITFSCTDLHINELSKTGFNLEFNTELKNNHGSLTQLATSVLEDTDWQLEENIPVMQEYREEPVYEFKTVEEFECQYYDENEQSIKNIIIPKDATILVFYSVISNKNNYFQFLYDESYIRETDGMLVINGKNCFVDVIWEEQQIKINEITIIDFTNKELDVSDKYRARRLVKSQLQEFDKRLNKNVYVFYNEQNEKVLCDISTSYKGVNSVINIATNPSNFSNLSGWDSNNTNDIDGLIFRLAPRFTDDIDISTYVAKSYLRIPQGLTFNSGFKDNNGYLEDGLSKGDKFRVRLKLFNSQDDSQYPNLDSINNGENIKLFLSQYSIQEGQYIPEGNKIAEASFIEGQTEYILEVNESFTQKDLVSYDKSIGFFIENNDSILWLEEIIIYKEILDDNGIPLSPNTITTEGIVIVEHKFYKPQEEIEKAEDLIYLYKTSQDDWKDLYTPAYNDKFEKIRSIEAKNSNRFNLIQTLAETFECYAKFIIEHDINGKISLDENYKPKKRVSFYKPNTERLGYGFVYGIDLKTISRQIVSDQIASKVIVTPNTNEFAENGFCTIARASENYPKVNFILNFDYFINHLLLDGGIVRRDLYSNIEGKGIGYYYNLNRLNSETEKIVENLTNYNNELLKQQALLTTYENLLSASIAELNELENDILSLTKQSSIEKAIAHLEQHEDFLEATSRLNAYFTTKQEIGKNEDLVQELKVSIENLDAALQAEYEKQKDIVNEIKELDLKFNSKYSRYIQEGSWKSDEYIDDNLYYLDAENVAFTSSRPKVSYNISVLRLTALEEFKNKKFDLGNITYIQDVEFFGYSNENTLLPTPKKEEVIISEITYNFDSPENDNFKVQNYKTQFEDLFQRITATTQSLQFASGGYQRAADAIQPDGSIKLDILQNSFDFNQNLAITTNDDVIIDNTGITIYSKSMNLNGMIKVTSNGIFLSQDGGITWHSGITPGGLNTALLTTGVINAGQINITSGTGAHSIFKWDTNGISAYNIDYNEEGSIEGINYNKFVRFDQYGIYGIDVIYDDLSNKFIPEKENPDDPEQAIWDTAKFGMTWKGFFMKNRGEGYQIEVSNENDIAIIKNEKVKIKIGRLTDDSNDPILGISINDDNGSPIIQSDDNGKLWLKGILDVQSTNNLDNIKIGYYKSENEDRFVSNQIEDTTTENVPVDLARTIDVENKFVVWEDGYIRATEGEFTGTINATGGQIGNLSIEDLENGLGGISVAVGNDKLIFNSEGLTIYNTGLEIVKDIYTKIVPNPTEFEDNIDYYEKLEDNIYVETLDTIPQPNKEYYTKSEEKVFYFNEETQSLYIEGSGIFSGELRAATGTFEGELKAATGSFTGEITASTGKIGGFIIEKDRLYSTAILQNNSPSIELKGTEGKIIANNIELGIGATIQDYIQLGDAFLYNPSLHNHEVLKTNDIIIYDTGEAKIGNIILSGSNSEIYGTNFSITPEEAIFQNVNVTGTIHSAVFEHGMIQVGGGAMLFRPTVEIIIEDNLIKPAKNICQIGDRVLLYNTITSEKVECSIVGTIENEDSIYYTVSVVLTNNLYDQLIVFASVEQKLETNENIIKDNLTIGINADKEQNNMLYPNAITFRKNYLQFDENGNIKNELGWENPLILLGDLTAIGEIVNISELKDSYGLYCENAVLYGSLTTQINEHDGYAGINSFTNTSSQILSAKYNDSSPIVFWAGAKETDKNSISNSLFHVTQSGSWYGQRGYISGTLITDSQVEAATLKTGVLLSREDKGLQIYDTAYSYNNNIIGIRFMGNASYEISSSNTFSSNETYFSLDANGITYSPILLTETNYEPNKYYTLKGTETLRVNSNGIYGYLENYSETDTPIYPIVELQFEDNNEIGANIYGLTLNATNAIKVKYANSYLTLKENIIGLESDNNQNLKLKFNENSFEFIDNTNKTIINYNDESNEVYINKRFHAGENVAFGNVMKYEKITSNNIVIGYDLYIG